MEPKFQTSFIPRGPVTPQSSQSAYSSGGGSFNIGKSLSVIVLILTILVSGGLFAYEMRVKQNVESLKVKLVGAKALFDSPENQKVLLASSQLKSIQELLTKHIVVSPLFELLEEQTLPTVRLSDFEFKRESTGVSVLIKVESQSYASLAQQAKIFSEVAYFKDLTAGEIALSDTGTVTTTFTAILDPELLMYSKQLQTVSFVNQTQ